MKTKEVSDTTSEKTAAGAARESSGPLWKTQHNRVQGAMWKHDQDGKARYTISVSRSYKDKEADKWMNMHYFDRQDLRDVRSVCDEAEEQILELEGMTAVAGED